MRGYDNDAKCDTIVNWFIKFDVDIGFVYFDDLDIFGQKYGPDSKEFNDKLIGMDILLGKMIEQLKKADIFDRMNFIITSDHGISKAAAKNSVISIEESFKDESVDIGMSVFGTVSNIFPTKNNVTILNNFLFTFN
jgi:predicted AlkP superfamily pyrophosphatase or phosphodiesterase